ncbi:MAG TPA: alpha/beta fold hydrolase [Anaerolineae bacterium]|nr:alpha/beta fold hydrolase [Anaerolineae bacterium]
MPTLIPSITNAAGERLGARLDLPLEGRPLAYAIFAHCFTCTKNIKAASHISRTLNRLRIAVLRFDFTGLGDSEGDFAETSFTSNVSDLVAVARFLAEEFDPPTLLIGHSLGGSAVLQAAQHIPSIVGVVTIAAPADTSHLARLLAGTKATAEQAGEARVTIGGATFRLKRQFFDDLAQANMRRTIETLDRALLVMHSPADQTVDIENAMQIFAAAHHPKSFVSLDTADHLLSNQRDSWYAGEVIAAWAGRWLRTAE